MIRLLGPALALLGMAAAAPSSAGTVALTFDDLPVFGHYAPAAEDTAITATLLSGLRRHHLVATGFVNEVQLQGDDPAARIKLLEAWLDAGMDLGNHSYSHLSLSTIPVETYIADVEKGGIVTGDSSPPADGGSAGSVIPISRPARPRRRGARSRAGLPGTAIAWRP